MSEEFYNKNLSDFFKEAEIVFIGNVKSYVRNPNEVNGDVKVSFEVVKQFKGEARENIDIYLDDGSTCENDYFLREMEVDEIYTIMASKDNWKMNKINKGKYTAIADDRVNKKFESISNAESFIKEACGNCKEIEEQKSESEIESKSSFFKRIGNWFLSLFR